MPTIDPQAKVFMDAMTEAFPKVSEALSAAEARAHLKANRKQGPAPDIARVEDRTIPGPPGAPEIPVRIYDPAPTATPRPLIVFYHGGGFVLGDLDTHDGTCRRLADGTGAIVVAVDYRLAPEARFPAAVDDAYAALVWAGANAADLGADPARIAVAGDSAGGNLAAVTAIQARDLGGPEPAFQLLVYPVTDLGCDLPSRTENGTGFFLTAEMMDWFEGNYVDGPARHADPLASPLRTPDLSGLPPALVITAECDPLRDEGEAYGRRLAEAGVPAEVHRVAGAFHGFFGMGGMLPLADHAEALACTALRKAWTETAQAESAVRPR